MSYGHRMPIPRRLPRTARLLVALGLLLTGQAGLAPGPGPAGGFVVRARIPYERAVDTMIDLPRAASW